MRMLLLAVTLVALCGGSYWALTTGPLAPGGGGVEGLAAEIAQTAAAVLGDDGPTYTGEERVFPRIARQAYPITGDTEEALLRAMLDGGPRSGETVFFGLTETEMDVRYDPVVLGEGCLIQNVRAIVHARVTLPEWTPPAGADPALVADWGRFRRALEDHEERHVEIAIESAERAYLAVAELYRPSCPDAIEEGRRRLERVGVEAGAVHRRFDAETGHGKTEGAVWPPAR